MPKKFRRPLEMKPDRDEKVPLSTRVRGSLRDRLQKEAEKADLSLAFLVEQVLEDYLSYLDSQKER